MLHRGLLNITTDKDTDHVIITCILY